MSQFDFEPQMTTILASCKHSQIKINESINKSVDKSIKLPIKLTPIKNDNIIVENITPIKNDEK